MVEALLLRWALTVVFAATGGWFVVRAVRRPGWPDRVSSCAHALMSAGMIAMAWPWGMNLPATAQVVAFALAGLWFLALAFGWLRARCQEGPLAHAHHALMMAAMVWMVVTMPITMSMSGGGGGGHHHHHGSAASAGAAGSMTDPGPAGLVFAVGLIGGGYFVLASLNWISSALDAARGFLDAAENRGDPGPPRAHALESCCHAAMSVGMGAMLLAMA